MKSIKEFIYLSRKTNIFYAGYYLFYKVSLTIHNFSISKTYRKKRNAWLEIIYENLNRLNNKREIVNGKELILKGVEDEGSKIYLRPFTSDILVYSQVIIQKSYQPVVEIYNQIFKLPPNNLIDLGANIGLTSVFFANTYNQLDIVAIEPLKDNVEMTELNMKSNHLKSYEIIHGGVWNKRTKLSVRRDFRDGKEWEVNLVEDSKGEINGYCLEELLSRWSFTDILKIDIEGAEKILFEDRVYASRFLKRVKCIALEIHDEFKCRDRIYEILSENNFFFYNIQDMTVAINKNYI